MVDADKVLQELVDVMKDQTEKKMNELIYEIESIDGISDDDKAEFIARLQLIIRYAHDEVFRENLQGYIRRQVE